MRPEIKFTTYLGKKTGRKLATVVGVAVISAAMALTSAKADVIGFGSDNLVVIGNTGASATGTTTPSWTINANQCCSGNSVQIDAGTSTLTLGGGGNYNAGSAFANTVQSTAPGWTSSFTFNEVAGSNQSTWAFVLQNDPRGANAKDKMKNDYAGGGSPLTSAVEVVFANGGSNILNVGFLNNGTSGAQSGFQASTLSTSLDFTSAPITANLSYLGTTLTLNLTQGANTYSATDTVDLSTLVGPTGYVGFDANRMDQGVAISNFQYTAFAVPEPSTLASTAFGFMALLAVMRLRSKKVA